MIYPYGGFDCNFQGIFLVMFKNHSCEYLYPFIIFLLSIGVYFNTLGNKFVYDDFREVVQNPVVHDLQLSEFWRTYLFTPDKPPPPARPFPLLTYAVNHAIGGLDPLGYHVINVLLHGCVCLLIYGITAIVFPQNRRLAFFTAALFACHPIHADVVCPVSGRSELLASTFMLLCLWIYLKSTPDSSSGWSWAYWLTLPLFFLSAMSKATAWSLPVVMAGVDAFRFGCIRRKSFRDYSQIFLYRSRKFYLPYIIIPVVIFLLILAIGYKPVEKNSTANFLIYLPFLERLLMALGILVRYLGLLIFPWNLSCDYGFAHLSSQSSNIRTFLAAGGVCVVLGGAWAAFVSFRKKGLYFMGIFVFASTYAMVSNMLVVINTPMAERLIYLPSWGFCFLLAVVLGDVFRICKKSDYLITAKFLMCFIFIILTTAYSVRTWVRNRDWKDQFTLMSSAYAICPMSARVNHNLAVEFEEKGQLKDAIFHYEKAALILPENPDIQMGLGAACAKAGHMENARKAFETAVKLNPDEAVAYFSLGKVLFDSGLLHQARKIFEQTVQVDSQHFGAWVNLGKIHQQRKNSQSAVQAYQMALKIRPKSWKVYYWLGNAHLTLGEFQAAIDAYENAVRYRHDFKEAWNNLGVAYLHMGHKEKALIHFKRALEVDPNYEEPLKNMGILRGKKN